MSTHRPTFYGVDRDYIEQVTAKARRERSEAVWAMLRGVFPSVTDEPRDDQGGRKEPAACLTAGLRPAAL